MSSGSRPALGVLHVGVVLLAAGFVAVVFGFSLVDLWQVAVGAMDWVFRQSEKFLVVARPTPDVV